MVLRLNSARGIRGYLATFASLYINTKIMTPPTTSKAMIFAESQGNSTPPKSKPSSIMSVKPRKETMPNQSTALMPVAKDVWWCWMSRKRRMRSDAIPHMGRLM